MSIAPVPPVIRSSHLVKDVTDASQNRSKQFIPSAYAVGKLFTGVTLKDDIDLNTYVTPGVSRINTYKNGPPVTSPGYLVIHSINPDEDESGVGVRYRQIYYPDSTTETTPYTRVGTGTSSDNITWSVWITMGGNWVCEILDGNKTGIVNYMYHSFNSWTLTLPDPSLYVQGTKIGLTQWLSNGKVVWDTYEQSTTPDITEEGITVGALQYIFQIVPTKDGTNIWTLDVDNNIDGTIDKLTTNFQSKIDTINTAITNLNAKIEKKQRLMKHVQSVTTVTITNGSGGYDISEFDYTLEVIGDGTVTINASDTGYAGIHGARLVLHIHPRVTTVVNYTGPHSTKETFRNTDTSDILVIDMQLAYVDNTLTWTILEVE